jgi:hypothetical protein
VVAQLVALVEDLDPSSQLLERKELEDLLQVKLDQVGVAMVGAGAAVVWVMDMGAAMATPRILLMVTQLIRSLPVQCSIPTTMSKTSVGLSSQVNRPFTPMANLDLLPRKLLPGRLTGSREFRFVIAESSFALLKSHL